MSMLVGVPWGSMGRCCCRSCDDESLASIIAFLPYGEVLLLELVHHSFEASQTIVVG
jgi:hypothetical protein